MKISAERYEQVIARLEARTRARPQDWKILFECRKRYAALYMPRVPVELGQTNTTTVLPSLVNVGDVLIDHGFTARVRTVKRYDGTNGVVTVAFCEYVAGDLNTFRYLRGAINNGCHVGHLARFQANDRRTWGKVLPTFDESMATLRSFAERMKQPELDT